MSNMTEVLLKDLNTTLDNVSTELKVLSEGKTVTETILDTSLTTVISAILGGYIAIHFFKRNESYSIKYELSKNFFEEYSDKYIELLNSLNLLKEEFDNITKHNEEFHLCSWKRNNTFIYYNNYTKKHILNIIKELENIRNNINDVYSYIKSEPVVTKNYIDDLFKEEKETIEKIYEYIKDINKYYSTVDSYNNNNNILFLEKDFDISICFEKLNDKIKYIINLNKQIDIIKNNVIEIHEDLQYELIEKYLKTNILKKIMNKNIIKIRKKIRRIKKGRNYDISSKV